MFDCLRQKQHGRSSVIAKIFVDREKTSVRSLNAQSVTCHKMLRCKMLLAIAGCLFVWQTVGAQGAARNETVANRARPELDALGMHLGGFLFFPELALTGAYDSNVFAEDSDETDDLTYVLAPSVEFNSIWSNHALNFGSDARITRFADNSGEDHGDYSIWGEGRLTAGRSGFLLAQLSHRQRHEGRESPDDLRGTERTKFDLDLISISYQVPVGPRRFNIRLAGEYLAYDFEDSRTADGVINNDDRDRRELSGALRLGYALGSAYSVFFQGSAHSIEYDDRFDDNGFERSSSGYEMALGTALDFSGVAFGDIFVGYRSETYDDARFSKIDGPSFGADVAWNISRLTTLTLSGRRTTERTTIVDASGIDATRVGLAVDHELLRNLILSLEWSAVKEDFKGIDRNDDIDSVAFSSRYLINRRFELEFEYSYRRRDTEPASADGFEFSRNLISLTAKVHL